MTTKVSLPEAKALLANVKEHAFVELMAHGTMSVEFFAPKGIDTQQPHKQDELYIIASGYATFDRAGAKTACQKGDLLFVPAGLKHHFEAFSNDFATWVIFYGKDGGEESTV